MMRFILILLVSLFASAAIAAPPRAVVFGFELIDTSLTGEMRGVNKDETARLDRLAPELREKLAATGRYEIIPLTPEAEAAAKAANLQSCGGCDVSIAGKLGADFSITGTVQKVSELILNINIYVRDVKTGRLVNAYSVDIRDNTDLSWSRGLDYIIRNRLPEPPPAALTQ